MDYDQIASWRNKLSGGAAHENMYGEVAEFLAKRSFGERFVHRAGYTHLWSLVVGGIGANLAYGIWGPPRNDGSLESLADPNLSKYVSPIEATAAGTFIALGVVALGFARVIYKGIRGEFELSKKEMKLFGVREFFGV